MTRGHWNDHFTMLLHTSHLIDKQKKIKVSVDDFVQELKFQIKEKEGDLELRSKLLDIWKTDFIPVSSQFNTIKPIPDDTLWRQLKKIIGQLEVIIDNSESTERLSFSVSHKLRAIVIGGNTLSRGLTLEGLLTSYFCRNSRSYDTLLQMGRWFGYRPGYVDLTRIYMSDELKDAFFHLATVEEEIRDEIRVMASNNEKPIDVGLRIRTHPGRTVTANNKMRTAKNCDLTYSGTKIQARYIDTGIDSPLKENFESVLQFLEKIEPNRITEKFKTLSDFKSSVLYRHINSERILQFLDEQSFSKKNSKFYKKLLQDYISDLLKLDELTDWSVALMGVEQGSHITLKNGMRIHQAERSIISPPSIFASRTVQLRSLSAPQDELVDLYDLLENPEGSVENYLKSLSNKFSGNLIRKRFRPKERGLLLLHPLNTNKMMKDDEFRIKSRKHKFTGEL